MQKFIKPIAFAFLSAMFFQNVEATTLTKNTKNEFVKDSLSLNTPLPFDKEVKVGKLPNGFTYFIRKNVEPKNRVTMYLAVKVGSILETEKQLGLAHFLEHMNFNGLKHFPKNELVNYLQKVGVSFGSDLNAYTGFEQTVYQLPIPSDDPEILKNGMLVMRDWAQDALLTSEEIDKERGVIMEEMRGGRGAMQRMRDKFFPVLLNNSRYANRLPIGTEEVVMKFPHEEIRKFHKDWYRPDLQAIIIVGDIDVAAMESEVKRLFSDMKTHPNPPKREEYTVPLLNKNQFIAITDPEMPSVATQLFIKHPKTPMKTIGDYRTALLKSVYGQMINNRLGELRQEANPPFLSASVGISDFLANLQAFTASVGTKPNEYETGFKALMRELERVKKFGFNQTEFDRAISVLNKSNEMAYIERDKRKSNSYVERYLNYFLEDEPAVGDEESYQIAKKVFPTLTLAEVNALTAQYYTDANRDIIILAPEKEKNNLPSEAQINTWIAEVQAETLTPYVDKVSTLPLLSKQPVKGSIVSEKNLVIAGTKELTLSNGVKVVLKPTTFKNNEILISGYSPGGTSLFGDNDYFSAVFASGLVNGSGVGQLNAIELNKYLTGKSLSVNSMISERGEGISAYSDKEGLATTFELIYAYFTEPRIDEDVFQSTITRRLVTMANQENDPNFVFGRNNSTKLYNGNIRRVPMTEANLRSVSKDKALEIYKNRFADASDFVFVIVGSFTEAEIKPYLEQYIASLPSLKRKEKARDLGIYEPKKGFKTVTHKGKEEKAMVSLAYYGDFKYNDMEVLNMNALESILTIKLLERLREEEGGVYGTGASFSASKYPKPRFSVRIRFGTSLEKYETLIKLALEEIEKIKKHGPSQVDLDKYKIEQLRQKELAVKENSFWGGYLMQAYEYQEPLQDPEKMLKLLDKITPKSVQKVANKYLKEAQLFRFILLPDQK
ncbi:pitrilysin family protein [Capnocytophaga sp.]|uniref:M16 family metallopeptidase n=1 Tax=Capnocytophaga sp. TaxID=44737 RepID=UPI0026DD12F8|nr:M16 family metallopeptidase [Capnocytophaga sp.]MDO5105852.1 insulinase family protein [Capnocytophaga sp.]